MLAQTRMQLSGCKSRVTNGAKRYSIASTVVSPLAQLEFPRRSGRSRSQNPGRVLFISTSNIRSRFRQLLRSFTRKLLERVVGACARTRGLWCPGSSLGASSLLYCRHRFPCTAIYSLYPLAACLPACCLISARYLHRLSAPVPTQTSEEQAHPENIATYVQENRDDPAFEVQYEFA